MNSTLTLNRSDPGVDDLVSAWETGGEYRVTLDIVQTSSDPKQATFDVVGIESDENETMQDDTKGKEATYGKHKGPAIVIAFKK